MEPQEGKKPAGVHAPTRASGNALPGDALLHVGWHVAVDSAVSEFSTAAEAGIGPVA